MTTIKDVFESDSWVITKIKQGRYHVRVDARRRFFNREKDNFFSEWVSISYADRLARDNYGMGVRHFSVYEY